MQPALIIIYNHRFDRNIEILERIYAPRFSHIFHLMPFYDGSKENVIPVYDNSFYFQGYVAQGFRHFFSNEFDHYLFVADDMVLNPVINENNYAEHFALDHESSFIPGLNSIPSPRWIHNRDALHFNPFNKKNFHTKGVEIAHFLPDKKEAVKMLEKFGVKNSSVSFPQVYGNIFQHFLYKMRLIVEDIFIYFHFYPHQPSYPLSSSYADIFVIDKSTIARFAHYCGIFSAARLFVEMAIPSALAFSAKKVVTSRSLSKQVQKTAKYNDETAQFLDNCQADFGLLLQNFPENQLYIHPIKLSQWNTKNI